MTFAFSHSREENRLVVMIHVGEERQAFEPHEIDLEYFGRDQPATPVLVRVLDLWLAELARERTRPVLLPVDLYDQGSVWLEVTKTSGSEVSLSLVDSAEEGWLIRWSNFDAEVDEVLRRPREILTGATVACPMAELVTAIETLRQQLVEHDQ